MSRIKLPPAAVALLIAASAILFAIDFVVPGTGLGGWITTNRLGLLAMGAVGVALLPRIRLPSVVIRTVAGLYLVTIWGIISVLASPFVGEGGASVLYVVPWAAICVIVVVVYNACSLVGPAVVRQALFWILVGGCAANVLTWVYLIDQIGVGGLLDPWRVRAALAEVGPGLNRHLNGLFALTTVALATMIGAVERRPHLMAVAGVSVLSLILLSVQAGSRQTLVAIAAFVLFLLLLLRKSLFGRKGLVTVLATAAVAVALGYVGDRINLWAWLEYRFVERTIQQYTAGSERLAIWDEGIRIAADHLLLGVGPGAFATAAGAYADNGYIALAAEYGIVPAIVIVVTILGVVTVGIRSRRYVASNVRGLHDVALAVVAVYGLVAAVFNELLRDYTLWLFVGVLIFTSEAATVRAVGGSRSTESSDGLRLRAG